MRKLLFSLALSLAIALVLSARLDPRLPFLFAASRLTWWCHPEPLSTLDGLGPHHLIFHFTPARAGRLEVAALSRFRLRDRDSILLEGPEPHASKKPSEKPSGMPSGKRERQASWKTIRSVSVPASPLTLEADDERRLPAVGLGGEAAPGSDVRVEREGVTRDAIRARSLFAVRPSLPDRELALAVSLLVVLLSGFAALAWRMPALAAAPPAPSQRLVIFILAVHALLAAWNTAEYPIERGLDASAHVAYARLILAEHRLPDLTAGFQTYQPPLYHALGALALAATGSERSLQILSALAGVLLVLVLARTLTPAGFRGLALIAFAPVLLIAEPQASNEVMVALLAATALAFATRGDATRRAAAAAGIFAGLSLLTRYTGLFVLCGVLVALALPRPGATFRRRAQDTSLALAVALLVGGAPYLERLRLYGDPFVGNWDDVLAHPYRQPPGVRMAVYFLRFGAAFVAHPFRAREASLWDSLYVSLIGDGFGRFITEPAQHVHLFLLAWAALPLLLTTLWGFAAIASRPESSSRLELAGLVMTLLTLAAVVQYNLELPYWSAAKGVFLLVLALPVAAAFERGHAAAVARGGFLVARFLDGTLLVFAAMSIFCFAYRA